MSTRRNQLLCCVLVGALCALPAFARPGAPDGALELTVALPKVPVLEVQERLDEILYEYSVFELDTATIERQVSTDGRLLLHLGNQVFDLALEVNDLRAESYREVLMIDGVAVEQPAREKVSTYRGHVVGDPDSIVRMTVLPDRFSGYVKTDHDWIFIDPVIDYVKWSPRGDVVVYRDGDVKPAAAGACGSGRLHHQARGLEERQWSSPSASRSDQPSDKAANTLQVATECDGQYYQAYGNPGSFNRISGILNDVDGIYESEINTSISIVYQGCWTNPSTDPYTSLNASTTLNQMRSYWNANMGSISRDAAHQFSGKDFSGGTVGIAWVGVICNAPSYSYGISQDMSSSAQRRRLTAHEIGHNLSASHDNQTPVCSGVSCNGNGPIMCSFVQTGSSSAADDFSSCSKSDINSHISTYGSCL